MTKQPTPNRLTNAQIRATVAQMALSSKVAAALLAQALADVQGARFVVYAAYRRHLDGRGV